MNCEAGFCIASSVWGAVFLRIRGELAIGAHLRAIDWYTAGLFDPDHDAACASAAKFRRRAHSFGRHQCHVRIRHPPPWIVNSAVVLKAARAETVLSGMLVPVSPFRTLDVRRRPPVVRQWRQSAKAQ